MAWPSSLPEAISLPSLLNELSMTADVCLPDIVLDEPSRMSKTATEPSPLPVTSRRPAWSIAIRGTVHRLFVDDHSLALPRVEAPHLDPEGPGLAELGIEGQDRDVPAVVLEVERHLTRRKLWLAAAPGRSRVLELDLPLFVDGRPGSNDRPTKENPLTFSGIGTAAIFTSFPGRDVEPEELNLGESSADRDLVSTGEEAVPVGLRRCGRPRRFARPGRRPPRRCS